jgi:hypothetical protein
VNIAIALPLPQTESPVDTGSHDNRSAIDRRIYCGGHRLSTAAAKRSLRPHERNSTRDRGNGLHRKKSTSRQRRRDTVSWNRNHCPQQPTRGQPTVPESQHPIHADSTVRWRGASAITNNGSPEALTGTTRECTGVPGPRITINNKPVQADSHSSSGDYQQQHPTQSGWQEW